jgi:hypothetical protein
MAVSNQTDKIYGSGNGVTQTFSYPFKIFDPTQLVVYLINQTTLVTTGPMVLNTDYTVTISSVTEGGTVTFTVAPASGYTWFVKRTVPYTQAAVIPTEGPLPGLQISNQLDLMTMMVIQDQEAITRCLQLPVTYTGSLPVTLPGGLANAAIGWDPTGTFLTNVLVTAVGTVPVPVPNNMLSTINTYGLVDGASMFNLGNIASGAGKIPVANLPTNANGVASTDGNNKVPYANLNYFPYVKVSETQSSGTGAGNGSTGAWNTRVLNTKDSDTANIATLSSNQITLPAGTYLVRASSPFINCAQAQARLYNVTASAVLINGSSAANNSTTVQNDSLISGIITIASTSVLAIQYQIYSNNSNALGTPSSFGTEVYTVAEFIKIG